MAFVVPRKKGFLKKPRKPVRIEGRLGHQTSFYTFFNESLYDSATGATGAITVDGSINPKGLVSDGVSHAGLSGDRALFTGSKLTAIAQVEIGALNNAWNGVVGTDGNFIRLELNFNSNGTITARAFVYIANAWRNTNEIALTGCAVGDEITIALTFDQPATLVHIAKNKGIFSTPAVRNFGAPLDDEGGEYVFGAQTTADVLPADCIIKNFFCVNKTFSVDDLRRYNENPYQILKPRRTYFVMPDVGGTTAALTGTVTTADEADIVAGGKTIILTLTDDTWVAAGATFDAQRQNIINGLDSAQTETTGWNNEVRDKEVVGAVVRTSSTVVTITLTAQAAYDITANETITATIPAAALVTSAIDVVATPTFTVSFVASGFQAAWAARSNNLIGGGLSR